MMWLQKNDVDLGIVFLLAYMLKCIDVLKLYNMLLFFGEAS